jgi:hypothetical protein
MFSRLPASDQRHLLERMAPEERAQFFPKAKPEVKRQINAHGLQPRASTPTPPALEAIPPWERFQQPGGLR